MELLTYSKEEKVRKEIRGFIIEGLKDVYNDNLLDFDSTFDELEERYKSNV